MIEHLTGAVLEKDASHVVLDVRGVGYGLDVSARTAAALPPVGAEARLWVTTHVTDSAMSLFGFGSRGEREVFEVFLGISGFGPRLGLAVLSTFSIEEIVRIAIAGDAHTLKKVPGIGLKKAEKLIVELKGRVNKLSAGIGAERMAEIGRSAPAGATIEFIPPVGPPREAVEALEALDLPPVAARRAIARAIEALGPAATTEALVREGLRHRRAG